MTGPELEAIVAAMTERPWAEGADERHVLLGPTVAFCRHATALVELVKACEAVKLARELAWQAGTDGGTKLAQEALAMRQLEMLDKLAAIHSITNSPAPTGARKDP